MGFSSEYWYSFHYSDGRRYLIFCCHCVATDIVYELKSSVINSTKSQAFVYLAQISSNVSLIYAST